MEQFKDFLQYVILFLVILCPVHQAGAAQCFIIECFQMACNFMYTYMFTLLPVR
jgi:hypothetical protein